jgi:hypothetical protein
MVFFSTTITPTTVPALVMANKVGIVKAAQIQIVVRSMGTATYVAVGGSDSQDRRLTAVGSNVGIDTPLGKRYLDLRTLFISSDSNDAVVEIIGDSLLVGEVAYQ